MNRAHNSMLPQKFFLQLVNIKASSQNMDATLCSDGTYCDYDLHYKVPSIKRQGENEMTKGYS